MITTRLSSKGQVVLPKKIRDNIKIRQGTVLQITLDGKRIILEPLQKSVPERLYGKYCNEPLLEALESEHEHEVAREVGS
jgi:AbrB family looped-hinge helix DNA binding protein